MKKAAKPRSKKPREKKPSGGPDVLIFFAIILTPTIIIGQLLGAGIAAIMGGFIGLFTLISCTGGSLRANLGRFVAVGPLVAVGAITPRLLGEVTQLGGMALAVVFVFIASILPLRGRRYQATALGMGMGVLLGYALPLGTLAPRQLFIAALSGLIGTALLIVLMGLKDSTGPTRTTIAGLLDGTGQNFAVAFDSWTADGSPRWLGSIILASGRYHLARSVLKTLPNLNDQTTAVLAWAEKYAKEIADHIRLKAPGADDVLQVGNEHPHLQEGVDGTASARSVRSMIDALDTAAQAATERDKTAMKVPNALRVRINAGAVRAGLGQGAIQMRHALRSTLAVTLAFVAMLIVDPSPALVPTLLMTTFALVQASWNETMVRARARFVGIIMGGVLVTLALVVLPESMLFLVAILGLVVGMWFITARPDIGVAGMILMSVGINFELRHLEPGAVLVEYILLALIAIVIATAIGFVVVPAWRPPALEVRIESARTKTVSALRTLASLAGTDYTVLVKPVIGARGAIDQLVADHDDLDDDQRSNLEATRVDLRNTLMAAIFYAIYDPTSGTEELERMADRLETGEPGISRAAK